MRTGDIKAKHKEAKRCIQACLETLADTNVISQAVRDAAERSLRAWREVEAEMGRRLAQRFKTDT